MNEKLLIINEEKDSSPYALIVKINEKLVISKLDKYSYRNFMDVLQSCLVEFINQKCEEYKTNDNSLDMTDTVYLWLVTKDLNLHNFLLNKINLINQIDIISSTDDPENLKQEISNKFTYYSLQKALENNQEQKKRIKL